MNIKIIIVLCILFLISLEINYIQFEKSKANQILIDSQKESISQLQNQIQIIKIDNSLKETAYKNSISEIRVSDSSFNTLTSKLATINCPTPKEIKNENYPNDDTRIINEYYSILHSAYSLQNKN